MNELLPPKIRQLLHKDRWTTWLPNLLILSLIIIALLLPPISLGKQLAPDPSPPQDGRVWQASDPDGTELTVLSTGLAHNTNLALELTRDARLAADVTNLLATIPATSKP